MPLRLTLRTLLAYLDDTLDSSQIKDIGQRVNESDNAQELIARIKQVTRRRRLTVPPSGGPGSIDPNDVAEYLDNSLSAEQIAEVEKTALESDVHLAEIAACHQILTLVLGEPALVPPTAKKRMYALVQGKEAIPAGKTQPAKKTVSRVPDEDGIGLSGAWLRWVLPLAGVLLVVALGLAIYQILPDSNRDNRRAEQTEKDKDSDKDKAGSGMVVEPADKGKKKEETPIVKGPVGTTPVETKDKDKDKDKDKEKDLIEVNPAVAERSQPPSKQRVSAGHYLGTAEKLPTALVVKTEGKENWQRLNPTTRPLVYTTEPLVTLPGFVSLIRTRSGVDVLMRGNLREFSVTDLMPLMQESAVVLHANDKFDLDLTLQRGRIFLANRKTTGPARIRLRFEEEVWDLTLASRGDEVGVDLFRDYSPLINYRKGEPPRAQCHVAILRGKIEVKVDAYHTHNVEADPPKWKRMVWDSFTRTSGPFGEDKESPAWNKAPPSPEALPDRQRLLRDMQVALKDLEALLSAAGKPVEVALREMLEKPDPIAQQLAIYCLAATDDVVKVVTMLGDEEPQHWPAREAAFFALRRWVSRGPGQGRLLFDEKTGAGLLAEAGYNRRSEAETIYQFLHPMLAENLGNPELYEVLARGLRSRRVAIAEMSFWHLLWLSPGVKLPVIADAGTPYGFNAAARTEDRDTYAQQIEKMVTDKKLPPPRPMGGGEK